MKNYRYAGILLVLVIIAAVSLAGCTTTSPSGATATPATGTSTISQPTSTAKPSAGGLASLFNLNSLHWYEYKMTASGLAMTTKTEYSTASFGGVSNARLTKVHTVMGEGAQQIVTDSSMYFDPATDKLLGGHTKMTMGDTVMADEDIKADDSKYANQDQFHNAKSQNLDASVTVAGSESVTVPAGTFAATKYVTTSSSFHETMWVAPNVPVPVKATVEDNGQVSMIMELTGWG